MPRKTKKTQKKTKQKQHQNQKQSINVVYPRIRTPTAFGEMSASRPYSSAATSVVNVSAPLPQTIQNLPPTIQQTPVNIFDMVGLVNRQLALESQQKNLESHVKSAMLSSHETNRILRSIKGSNSSSSSGPSSGPSMMHESFTFPVQPDQTMASASSVEPKVKASTSHGQLSDDQLKSMAISQGFNSVKEMLEVYSTFSSSGSQPTAHSVIPVRSTTTINVPGTASTLSLQPPPTSTSSHVMTQASAVNPLPAPWNVQLPPGSVGSSTSSKEANTQY